MVTMVTMVIFGNIVKQTLTLTCIDLISSSFPVDFHMDGGRRV